VRELQSLIHYGFFSPALSNAAGTAKWTAGDAFNNVVSSLYWSSTANGGFPEFAWIVNFNFGDVDDSLKTLNFSVLPVRGP
jgi:hypothetical protein